MLKQAGSLDLGFLVFYMFAYHRVVLLHDHLVGGVFLVLVSGVVVAGASARYQFDLISHKSPISWSFCRDLYLFAAFAHISQNRVDAVLVDNPHAFGGNTQFHPAVFRLYPEFMGMQVRQEATARLVMRMRYIVSRNRLFPCNLAYSGHVELRIFNLIA